MTFIVEFFHDWTCASREHPFFLNLYRVSMSLFHFYAYIYQVQVDCHLDIENFFVSIHYRTESLLNCSCNDIVQMGIQMS
jgi:hypothetical protein